MNDFSKYYRAYMYMQEILEPDFTHKYLQRSMEDSDKGEDILTGKTNEKVIDMDWVQAMEEALPYIQKAIDEQRRFIMQVENVVRVEKAKKITTVVYDRGGYIYHGVVKEVAEAAREGGLEF